MFFFFVSSSYPRFSSICLAIALRLPASAMLTAWLHDARAFTNLGTNKRIESHRADRTGKLWKKCKNYKPIFAKATHHWLCSSQACPQGHKVFACISLEADKYTYSHIHHIWSWVHLFNRRQKCLSVCPQDCNEGLHAPNEGNVKKIEPSG